MSPTIKVEVNILEEVTLVKRQPHQLFKHQWFYCLKRDNTVGIVTRGQPLSYYVGHTCSFHKSDADSRHIITENSDVHDSWRKGLLVNLIIIEDRTTPIQNMTELLNIISKKDKTK